MEICQTRRHVHQGETTPAAISSCKGPFAVFHAGNDSRSRTRRALGSPEAPTHDIKWLIVYVILSRVPSLKQLVSIGLTSKIRELIEGGPPEELVQTFSTLFEDKIEATKAAAKAARQRLGW